MRLPIIGFMANAMYPKFKEALLKGDVALDTDTVKWAAVDTDDYTYDSTDEFVSDVAAGAIVGESAALTNKTFTGGVFDADDTTITGLAGDTVEALILFIDTGVDSTSRLIMYLDSVDSGLPLTPNGGDVNITHDNGANKIFAITG